MEFPDLKRKVLLEEAGIGIGLFQQLGSERSGVHVIGIRPEGSKTDRAAAQSAVIEAGSVLIPRSAPWLGDFRTELLAFPMGKYDDQVDSMSQLLNWAETRSRKRVGNLFR